MGEALRQPDGSRPKRGETQRRARKTGASAGGKSSANHIPREDCAFPRRVSLISTGLRSSLRLVVSGNRLQSIWRDKPLR